MARYAVAGCKISIGGAVADKNTDFVAADFTSQTWVEIGEWVTMGDLGDAAATITSQIIGLARDKNSKGTRQAPAYEAVFNRDDTDPGQIAIRTAEKTNNNFAIKIEYNDKPAVGAAPKNSVEYFIALVSSARGVGGTANTNRTLAVSLLPNSNIVLVPASAT
jgi:hypothetical protein